MKVIVAKPRGFCAGVRRAVQLAEQSLRKGKQVYSLGPVIHNTQVVERLGRQGLIVAENLAEVPDGAAVLIRSHGEGPGVFLEAQRRGLEVIDGTCVLVRRAQNIVQQLHQQGYQVVIVGDPNHPEVRGILAHVPSAICLNNEADIHRLSGHHRLGIVCQTTYSPAEFERMVDLVSSAEGTEVEVVNTICQATQARQQAALEVSLLVVFLRQVFLQQVVLLRVVPLPLLHQASLFSLALACTPPRTPFCRRPSRIPLPPGYRRYCRYGQLPRAPCLC